MLSQQLTADMTELSGRLVITAGPGALVELQGLAQELGIRQNITTNGNLHLNMPPPDEVPPDS